jgi:pSer/pThr/pTyr-binding forkhead associated (FHA) protein
MKVQCTNADCRKTFTIDTSKMIPGSSHALRCKCGTETKFQAAVPESSQPQRNPNKTWVLDDYLPQSAAQPNQVGWLVVHDENTASQTLTLKEGRNVIGRKSPDKPCEIMIDTTDTHMSRNHSVIDVNRRADGHYQYVISDCGSTNGTFINANERQKLSSYDRIFLKDGDTIQLGRTKVVLKTQQTVSSPDQAQQVVNKKDYLKTVILS